MAYNDNALGISQLATNKVAMYTIMMINWVCNQEKKTQF